jgi:hypothetical protein
VDDVEVLTIELDAPGTSEVMLGAGDVTVRLNPRPSSPKTLNRRPSAYWAPNEPETELA